MKPFRAAEIRVIVLLSILILAGSILHLLKRQGTISSLDLGIFTDKSYYKYDYKLDDLKGSAKPAALEEDSSRAIEPVQPEKIDINRAGFFDLQALPGIGPSIAREIIAYRDSVGRFEEIDDLLHVSGIGPVKLKRLRELVSVE